MWDISDLDETNFRNSNFITLSAEYLFTLRDSRNIVLNYLFSIYKANNGYPRIKSCPKQLHCWQYLALTTIWPNIWWHNCPGTETNCGGEPETYIRHLQRLSFWRNLSFILLWNQWKSFSERSVSVLIPMTWGNAGQTPAAIVRFDYRIDRCNRLYLTSPNTPTSLVIRTLLNIKHD